MFNCISTFAFTRYIFQSIFLSRMACKTIVGFMDRRRFVKLMSLLLFLWVLLPRWITDSSHALKLVSQSSSIVVGRRFVSSYAIRENKLLRKKRMREILTHCFRLSFCSTAVPPSNLWTIKGISESWSLRARRAGLVRSNEKCSNNLVALET